MDVIAAEAGVAKPVLYRYFESRHGLNIALAERFSVALAAELYAALARDAGPRALLRVTMDAYLRVVESEPSLYRWLTQWAQAEHPQAVTGLVAQFGDTIAKVFRQRLEALGLDATPSETWAYGIVGMVQLAGDRWLEDPQISREELVTQLVTLIWDGISGYASGLGVGGAGN